MAQKMTLKEWLESKFPADMPPTNKRGPGTKSWLAKEAEVSWRTIHMHVKKGRPMRLESAQRVRRATKFKVSIESLLGAPEAPDD